MVLCTNVAHLSCFSSQFKPHKGCYLCIMRGVAEVEVFFFYIFYVQLQTFNASVADYHVQ